MASNTLDWSQDTNILRKHLLKLTKAKLSKICKDKRISVAGCKTKQDFIQRILSNKKTSKKKRKKRSISKKQIKNTEMSNNHFNQTQKAQTFHPPEPPPPLDIPIPPVPTDPSSARTYNNLAPPVPTAHIWPIKDANNIRQNESISQLQQALVFDNGSGMVKVGFSGDDDPRAVFPNVVGRLPHQSGGMGWPPRHDYVGDEAQAKLCPSWCKNPVEFGIVTNWDDMEKVLHHTFKNELRVVSSEHPLLITETITNPQINSEKMTQIVFETFNVPAYFTNPGAVLSLYASGRTTGVVVESGHSVTHIVPIYEGYPLRDKFKTMNIAGNYITDYMEYLLAKKGHSLSEKKKICQYSLSEYLVPISISEKRMICRDIKEKLSFVAMDYDHELKKATESVADIAQNYELPLILPDGKVLSIDTERFQCIEPLFDPKLVGVDSGGIHQVLYDTVMGCDADIHMDLFENIVLAGGNTMFDGIGHRLKHEISRMGLIKKHLVDGYLRTYHGESRMFSIDVIDLMAKYAATIPKVVSPPERKYSSWIGGSILTSLSTFEEMWITAAEYDEFGPSIVNKKCRSRLEPETSD
eukprot:680330_1